MARQRISVFEKHVEKGVVAIFAGVLVWVVTAYVVRSPNTKQMKTTAVDPASIDEYVEGAAKRVWQKITSAQPEAVEIPDLPKDQAELAAGSLARSEFGLEPELSASVPFGFPVPDVQGPGVRGQVMLAGLLAPDKPEVRAGRYSAFMPPGDSTPLGEDLSQKDWELMAFEKEQDVSWVTVALRFDVEAQKKAFLANEYETTRLGVEAAAVSLQRQRALAGGGWGDWEDVHTYKMHVIPEAPPMELFEDSATKELSISIDERKAFREWVDEVRLFRDQLVRPKMPKMEFGDEWVPPLCSKLSRLYLEEAFECPIASAPQPGRRLSPRKQAEADLELARKLLDDDRIEEAKELVQKVLGNQRLPRSLRNRAGTLESDVLSREDQLVREAILAGEDEELESEEGEEPDRREEIYLAHDLTAEPGESYRYRGKIQAYNQYAMVPDRLKEPTGATQPFIEGEWSEPSDPVRVPLLRRVFLTKADSDPDKRSARFDVYVWTLGEWVKDSVGAKVGEEVGKKKQKVQHFGLGEKIEVDFDTGLTIVDVLPETERSYQAVKRTRDGGFEVADPEPTEAVLCVGRDRRVVEFLVEADKNSEEKRNIQKEIDAAKRRAEAEGSSVMAT